MQTAVRPGGLEVAFAVGTRLVAVFLPVIVGAGIWRGGAWTWAGVFVVFGFLTLVEILLELTGVGAHSRDGEDEVRLLDVGARAQLWIYAFGHIAVMPFALYWVATGHLGIGAQIGAALSLASMAGTVGGLGGHELMHKRTYVDRLLGIGVYATSTYGHFIASHVGGHHVNAGRHEDWGTARRGESIYAFLYRATVHGYVGAFRIEGERLQRQGKSPWSPASFAIRYTVFAVAMVALVGVLGGVPTLLFYLATAVVSVAFMELFNYISHYGLVRTDASAGDPEHTWESNNKVVNWFIFNAGMHCAHHHKPAHGFERLRLFHGKDYIPYGIAGMALLSFASPLYLRKMEGILVRREQLAQTGA